MTAAIPNSVRRLIHYHYKILHRTAENIKEELLSVPTQNFTVSLKHLKKLLKDLDNDEYAALWIEEPSKSSGRPRVRPHKRTKLNLLKKTVNDWLTNRLNMGSAGISLESETVREGDARMVRQRHEISQIEDNIQYRFSTNPCH